MRVAFIPSAYRTIFFHALSNLLEQSGHEIFWLSPNQRWARWLTLQGVDEDRVLDVTQWGRDWTEDSRLTPEEENELQEIEKTGTLRLRNIILMDSLLGRKGASHALKYFAVCARRVADFLSSKKIHLVLGEQTWAFELLTGQVCRHIKVPHLIPHTVRIPDPRFGFFDGPLETTLIRFREVTDSDRTQAEDFLRRFRQRHSQPGYMRVNRAVLRSDWGRIKLLTRHVFDLATDPFDETSRRPLGLILDHTKRFLRGKTNSLLGPFSTPSSSPKRPYVFFPLHMQPEASIDVKGDPYSNQVEIVRAMARTLPLTHDLYVKEHSVALPMRSRQFYRTLLSIPSVQLIDPCASSIQLISRADLVVTITGTAAYEAALFEVPAATIAPIFFDQIVDFPQFDPFQDSLGRLLASEISTPSFEAKLEFLAWLTANSFPGTVGDALWQPDSMKSDNLSEVAHGFLALFNRYDQKLTETVTASL